MVGMIMLHRISFAELLAGVITFSVPSFVGGILWTVTESENLRQHASGYIYHEMKSMLYFCAFFIPKFPIMAGAVGIKSLLELQKNHKKGRPQV